MYIIWCLLWKTQNIYQKVWWFEWAWPYELIYLNNSTQLVYPLGSTSRYSWRKYVTVSRLWSLKRLTNFSVCPMPVDHNVICLHVFASLTWTLTLWSGKPSWTLPKLPWSWVFCPSNRKITKTKSKTVLHLMTLPIPCDLTRL